MMSAKNLAIVAGGVALLAAAAIDTIAVIGRNIGLPLTGSIEAMQAAVVISGGIGLIIATIEQSHARVRLVVDRLTPEWRVWADRASDVLTLIFVVALLAGSIWLAADLWHAHEQSELLGIPWRLLRMVANGSLLAVSVILVWRIAQKARP